MSATCPPAHPAHLAQPAHGPRTAATRSSRPAWRGTAAVLAAAFALSGPAAAVDLSSLTVLQPVVSADAFDLLQNHASQTSATYAEAALPGASASARFDTGTLRSQAQAAGAGTFYNASLASFAFVARYDGAGPLAFSDLAIQLDISASFSRSLGTATTGTVAQGLVAGFALAVLQGDGTTRALGGAGYQYGHSLTVGEAPVLTPVATSSGGFTLSMSPTADGLSGWMRAPDVLLQPGDALGVDLFLTTTASLIGVDSADAWSIADASHTGRIQLQLPTGLQLVSDQPLPWVTTAVPEPASAGLMALGVAALGWRLSRRGRARAAGRRAG